MSRRESAPLSILLCSQAFEELEELLGKHNICIAIKEKLVKDSGVAEEIAYDNIVSKLLTKPRARGKIKTHRKEREIPVFARAEHGQKSASPVKRQLLAPKSFFCFSFRFSFEFLSPSLERASVRFAPGKDPPWRFSATLAVRSRSTRRAKSLISRFIARGGKNPKELWALVRRKSKAHETKSAKRRVIHQDGSRRRLLTS